MNRRVLAFILILSVAFSAFAGQFNTVPVGHEAYRIIEYGEICGIIPIQSKAKPYDYNTVRILLQKISESSELNAESKDRIELVKADLERIYGFEESKGSSAILKNGYYRVSNDDKTSSFEVGVKGMMHENVGLDNHKDKILDLRNSGTLFFKGDLFDKVSFDMNATMKLDKLTPRAYLTEEFIYDADGDYFIGFAGADNTYINKFEKVTDGIYAGFKASPEITFSFVNNKLKLRLGSFARDWGPGVGNLVLSKTAPQFSGFEFIINPVSWFNFSCVSGSLNRPYATSVYGINRPGAESITVGIGEDAKTYDISNDNMFGLQRIEFTSERGFQFALYESVVWRKRLELSYLNPFNVYWFTQSMVGDVDNVLGGADFSWYVKNLGRLYFSISVDEFTADLKHLISGARNVVGLQGGLEFPGKLFGAFTTFSLQATYLSPFYGAHNYKEVDEENEVRYSTNYTNKGFNLFYAMNPDSLELLMNCDMSFRKGWGLSVCLRDQMRSAQYALDQNGTTVLTSINYSKDDEYASKKFFKNIWENTLDIGVNISKEFEDSPVKLGLGIDGILDWTRPFTVEVNDDAQARFNGGKYNLGHNTHVDKDWNTPDIRVVGHVLFSLYY